MSNAIVLFITNVIFMGTIIKMWALMKNHAYLRKNECLMIARWVIDLIYTISQFNIHFAFASL